MESLLFGARRAHPEHRAAQRRGRDEFYESYSVTRTVVVNGHNFQRPDP